MAQLTTTTISGDLSVSGTNDIVPSTTKAVFKQGAAPTGWTFVSEDNDRALINTNTESDGGATGGTWQLPDVSGHALTEAELPNISGYFEIAWRHGESRIIEDTSGNFSKTGYTDKDKNRISDHSGTPGYDRVTFSFGSGNSHNHSQANTWRPSYAKVITCQKD